MNKVILGGGAVTRAGIAVAPDMQPKIISNGVDVLQGVNAWVVEAGQIDTATYNWQLDARVFCATVAT